MLHLSFDLDWAPAWATAATGARLAGAGVRGTFFVTHRCDSLDGLRERGMELGWHPNFLRGSSHGDTIDEVLDFCAGLVPDAVGARAHCLIRGTPYLQAYGRRGLRYDASDIHDGVAGLEPFDSWTGVRRLPIWFEDDVHLARGLPCRFDALDHASPGLKILNFHPVLLALNAADGTEYTGLKQDLSARGVPLSEATLQDFSPWRQTARSGVSDLLGEVLDHLAAHPHQAGGPLREIA